MHQKSAPSESRAAAAVGEGRPRPRGRRPRAATRGRHGAAGGAGERRAPCTSCSVHAAFHRPARAEPASGPRHPLLPAPCPRDAAPRRDAAGAPSGWQGPREPSRRQNFCAQPSGSPFAWAFAFAPPPPSSPPSPRRGTGRVPGSRLVHSAAEDCIYIQTVSLSPDCPVRRRHGRVVFQIIVFTCTCLSDYFWESVGGAQRVENVASLCKRKKTLSPSGRPLPRVTRRDTRTRTALGFDFASLSP